MILKITVQIFVNNKSEKYLHQNYHMHACIDQHCCVGNLEVKKKQC